MIYSASLRLCGDKKPGLISTLYVLVFLTAKLGYLKTRNSDLLIKNHSILHVIM